MSYFSFGLGLMLGLQLWLGLGSEYSRRSVFFICQSEPSTERVKVGHVITKCRVINHLVSKIPYRRERVWLSL